MKYRKADNCGPVPYPDRSGRFLHAGEIVEGHEWQQFVPLNYVVPVVEQERVRAETKSVEYVNPKPLEESPAPLEQPVLDNPKDVIVAEDTQGEVDVLQQRLDGAGGKELDPSETGQSSDEGLSGRAANRRRR